MIVQGNQPIFEAVADYFRKMISLGVLKEGDALPSVRDVALGENINPNTVVRAYSLLVDEGLIISIPKKGYYVAHKETKLEPLPLEQTIKHLLSLGYSEENIIQTLKQLKGAQDD